MKVPAILLMLIWALLPQRLSLRIIATPPATSLIQVSNLSCTGAFATPGLSLAGASNYPITMRYESGARHYFAFDGSAHIVSFPEPTLSPCNTALGSLNQASFEAWGGDWGTLTVHAGDVNAEPGTNGSGAYGLMFDATGRLVLSWSGTYALVGTHNSLAAVTLNGTSAPNVGPHTLTLNGCWGLSGVPMVQSGTGVVTIPSSFVGANLSPGQTWGVGMGYGFATVGAGISEGPTMYATVPPSNNACPALTDTLVSSTKIWGYDNNSNGPNCAPDIGQVIGCSPPTPTPTPPPLPLQIADTRYSMSVYTTDWEPYAGHGWARFETYGTYTWYDDGVKSGLVTPYTTSEGWLRGTVASSTSATDFVVSTVDTHDTFNLNPGDWVWVQTCDPSLDAQCQGGNGRELSFGYINTINTSTKAINWTPQFVDFGSGNHFPIPGKVFEAGCIYAHGQPTCSRWIMRMQVFDPNDLASVAQGTLQPYQVVATDDQEIDQTLITGFGTPAAGAGISNTVVGLTHNPQTIIADTTNHDLIVNVNGTGTPRVNYLYVLHITEPLPAPTVAEQLAGWLADLAPHLSGVRRATLPSVGWGRR